MYKCVWKIPEISREANNIYYIANIDIFKYIYIYITKKSVGMLQRIMGDITLRLTTLVLNNRKLFSSQSKQLR